MRKTREYSPREIDKLLRNGHSVIANKRVNRSILADTVTDREDKYAFIVAVKNGLDKSKAKAIIQAGDYYIYSSTSLGEAIETDLGGQSVLRQALERSLNYYDHESEIKDQVRFYLQNVDRYEDEDDFDEVDDISDYSRYEILDTFYDNTSVDEILDMMYGNELKRLIQILADRGYYFFQDKNNVVVLYDKD